jgi:hypothetical protein
MARETTVTKAVKWFGVVATVLTMAACDRRQTAPSAIAVDRPGNTATDLNGRWIDRNGSIAAVSAGLATVTIDMSDFHRPTAHGSIVNESTITVTFPDDATFDGYLQSPNTIRWSNGSVWKKL